MALSTVTLLAQLAHKRTLGFIADFNQRVVLENSVCVQLTDSVGSVAIPRIARYENATFIGSSHLRQNNARAGFYELLKLTGLQVR